MDSEDGSPKQDGEALEIGEEFDSEEDVDEDSHSAAQKDAMRQPMKANMGAVKKDGAAGSNKGGDVKGEKVQNQPFDLAVDVDDSEEIDSDEENDGVMDDMNVAAAGN